MKQKIYKSALDNAPIGYAYHRIILDKEGVPIDFEYLEMNSVFEDYTGLDRKTLVGRRFSENKEIKPDRKTEYISIFGDVAINGVKREFEEFSEMKNKWYNVKVTSPEKHFFITYLTDISVENQLIFSAEKLLQYSTDHIDYKKITETVLEISGAAYGALSLYNQAEKELTTVAFAGKAEDIKQAEKHLGYMLEGKNWKIYSNGKTDVSQNIITRFTNLHEFLYLITPDPAKKNIQKAAKTIEKTFNIGETVIVKIMKDDFIIGSFLLLMPGKHQLMNSEVVKLYARQIGLLITHKKEEESLKDSKLQYKVLFESNLAGIFVIDKEAMELLLINETAIRILEFQNADDLKGMNPLKLVHPLDREKATRIITDDMFKNDLRKAEELRVLTKSGKELWIRTVGARINYKSKTAGLVSFYDITERKQTEEALFNKNKLLTELNNYSMELSSVSASDNIFSIAARRLKMLTGAISVIMSHYNDETSELVISYTTLSDNDNNRLKQIIGREVKGLRIKLSSEEYSNIISEKQAYKDSLTDTTFGKISPSLGGLIKKIFNYQWFGGLALIYKDKLVGTMVIVGGKESVKPDKDVLSTFAGITANALQRWNAEKSLKDSEEKYRFITENTVDFIWLMDLKLKYTFISPSVKKMLGYSVDEFINLPLDKFLTEESLKHVYSVFNSEIELEKNSADISDRTRSLQFEAYKKDGSQIWIGATMSFYRNNDNKPVGILGVSRNITEQKLAEIKLIESEGKFRDLAENSPFAIMIYQQNKFVYTNQMGELISGFNKEELYNMNYWDFTHPDHKELIKGRGQKRQEGKLNIITYDFKIIRKDKQTRWVTLTGSMINYNGMPAGLISVIDITQRKKAEEELKRSEHQFKMLLEELPDIVIVHQNGKIVYANKATINTVGLPKEEFLGTSIFDYIADEHKKEVSDKINQRSAGEVIDDYEIDVFIKPGVKRNTIIRTTDIEFERKPSILSIIIDITEQKKAQKLEQEVAVAKQSAQFKQNFLANMSHEIRTPLTGIVGMAEFLDKTKLNDNQQEYLNTIRHSTENLREIIDLILDYSKIEAGEIRLKKSTFSINSLFENAESLFKSICKKNIEFEANISNDIPEFINSDKNRINQILNNLTSNAVKYTEQGKVTVNASLAEQKVNQKIKTPGDQIIIKIEVKDTGVGIKPELQKQLFKPFSQIEQGDIRVYEGTGLGLSICKELTELLDGDIGVDSTPGKGSTFWFTFEATISQPGSKNIEKPTQHKKNTGNKSLKILLAEDKKVTQKVISLILKSLGHEVVIANNGKEALKIFDSDNFDLVLMDIQMPVMDGITATKVLKEKYKNIPPIVGVSANAFEGDREKYMNQGMDEYMTKPLKTEDFNKVLKELRLL